HIEERGSGPGDALYQAVRGRLPLYADRIGAGGVLEVRVSIAVSGGAGTIRETERARSVFSGGADPAGVGVQSEGGFANERSGVDADSSGDGARVEPQVEGQSVRDGEPVCAGGEFAARDI